MSVPVTAPLTEERLAEIRERAEAASPGPWERGLNEWAVQISSVFWGDGRLLAEMNILNEADMVDPVAYERSEPNAEFIAHAREDVPWLLAEVVRLMAEREAREAALTRIRDNAVAWHGNGEDGPRRALVVIAGWCENALSAEAPA